MADGRRTRSAATRLTSALAELTSRACGVVTAAELCRVAGVSRNSLYRDHAPILDSLRQHQRKHSDNKPKDPGPMEGLRAENATLRERVAKLAALVDHYYGAYRETDALLQRRERDLAEVRRSLKSKPVVVD